MSEFCHSETWAARGTLRLAQKVLGLYLVRTHAGRRSEHLITEVEAYDGERDRACHARFGRTARSAPLYAEGGIWYVYLCYGMHQMLNLVVGPAGWPAAILIRSVADIAGPGRLTKALAIGRVLNGRPATPTSGLFLEDHGVRVPRRLIQRTPRIGVDYAGPVWARKPWRFTFDPAALPARHPAPRPR
ncbi:MAG: DNA-3-methyladenine glycosylase [Opitutales bacterium]